MPKHKTTMESPRLQLLADILGDREPHSTAEIEDIYRAHGRRNVAVGSTVSDLRDNGYDILRELVKPEGVSAYNTYRLVAGPDEGRGADSVIPEHGPDEAAGNVSAPPQKIIIPCERKQNRQYVETCLKSCTHKAKCKAIKPYLPIDHIVEPNKMVAAPVGEKNETLAAFRERHGAGSTEEKQGGLF